MLCVQNMKIRNKNCKNFKSLFCKLDNSIYIRWVIRKGSQLREAPDAVRR